MVSIHMSFHKKPVHAVMTAKQEFPLDHSLFGLTSVNVTELYKKF